MKEKKDSLFYIRNPIVYFTALFIIMIESIAGVIYFTQEVVWFKQLPSPINYFLSFFSLGMSILFIIIIYIYLIDEGKKKWGW